MASGGGMEMDHQEITALGNRWKGNVPSALKQLTKYGPYHEDSSGGRLAEKHFGGTAKAAAAATAFESLMSDLDTSVGTAAQYADSVAEALVASAKATTETEAENTIGLNESGGGL